MTTHEPNSPLISATVELSPVSTASEVRENIRRSNRDMRSHRDRATTIARQTTYWAFDDREGEFGPSKFVGYRNMNFAHYELALSGAATGSRFDGAFTRSAIEAACGEYQSDESLSTALRDWCKLESVVAFWMASTRPNGDSRVFLPI
ncbi:MAG: hypothetical protein ABGZ17_21790 [Planctomycetaceae bacterium]